MLPTDLNAGNHCPFREEKGADSQKEPLDFDRTVPADTAIITGDVFDHARIYCLSRPVFGRTCSCNGAHTRKPHRAGVERMALGWLFLAMS